MRAPASCLNLTSEVRIAQKHHVKYEGKSGIMRDRKMDREEFIVCPLRFGATRKIHSTSENKEQQLWGGFFMTGLKQNESFFSQKEQNATHK